MTAHTARVRTVLHARQIKPIANDPDLYTEDRLRAFLEKPGGGLEHW